MRFQSLFNPFDGRTIFETVVELLVCDFTFANLVLLSIAFCYLIF